jgi:GNAT superfamily N-acetyltransferase
VFFKEMAKMDILPTTPAHYPGLAALYHSIKPEIRLSASDFTEGDRLRDPKFKTRRWVAIVKDEIVGAGYFTQSNWFAHPQKFMIWIGVHPRHQRGGIGSAFYNIIMHGLEPFEPLALRSRATDDCPHSIRFLEKRGFIEVIRDIPSELNVQVFDLTRFTGLEDRFRGSGIEIKTLPELENDRERNRKLYDLDWELSLSVPGDLAAGMERRGFEKYIEYAITGPSALPYGFFVAVKGEEYIGLSHVLVSEQDISLYQGLTGVKPQYRRCGIGLAMKIRAISYAQAHGYTRIIAENDAKNIPMLTLNERLGFVRKPDVITFEKQCRPSEN